MQGLRFKPRPSQKIIIDLRGSCQFHQLHRKYLFRTPSYHRHFLLLYLFHIVYPLNLLTTSDPLNIPKDYSRRYHSAVNYLPYIFYFSFYYLNYYTVLCSSLIRGTCVVSYLSILNNSPMSPSIIIFHVVLSSHLLTSLNSLRSLSLVYVLDLLLSWGNHFYLCMITLPNLDVKLKDPHLYSTR